MEERLHCLCRVRLDATVIYVVWYSNDVNGFLRDAAGRLVVAYTPEALASHAGTHDVLLMDSEPVGYDFDRIRAWCAAPDAAGVDCSDFLNAWNFLDDLDGLHDGSDNPYARLSREAAGCYEKLFWGNDLPAVTPPGERFEPDWRAHELTEIGRVLEAGLELLESELRSAGVRT